MDPYLERYWESIHHSYVQYSRDQLTEQLPAGLFADVEDTLYVMDIEGDSRRIRPDIAVIETDRGARGGASVLEATAEPVRIRVAQMPVVEGHIAIRELRDGFPLVTAIEVISPANKTNLKRRKEYIQKREAYYDARASVVEIDLLRDGESLVDAPIAGIGPDLMTPYMACVRPGKPSRGAQVEIEFYPLPLRQRLPRIRIPLRPGDEDVILDLQQPIDLAYEKGRYAIRVNYAEPPVPPLSTDDANWARELIANRQ